MIMRMDRYKRIIYWSDDDNKFLVEIPELAGCMADGKINWCSHENFRNRIKKS